MAKQIKKYPECEKIAKVKDQSQVLGEFLEWLDLQGMFVAEYDRLEYPQPIRLGREKLLAKYFKIDLDKAEKEKQSILKSLQHA